MIVLPLQDYLTVREDQTATAVTQSESDWLDLGGYQDLVAFLEVKEVSGGTVQINYQTAPTKDDLLFVNMAGAVTLVAGLSVTKMLKASALTPLGRFARWKLTATPTGVWSAYFRVWLAANLSTRRGRVPLEPSTRARQLPAAPSTPLSRAAYDTNTIASSATSAADLAGRPGSLP